MAAVIPVEMPVAVRAWAGRTPKSKTSSQSGSVPFKDVGPSRWTLVFDTETTTDPGQSLRVGAYQLWRGRRLAQAGLFYEPAATSPQELETLIAYAMDHELLLLTRTEFVDGVFLPTAWERRGLIVGQNLPFDLARLSIAHHPPQSRGARMRGGFAFELSEIDNASCIQVKRTNAGAAFIRLTIPGGMNPELRNRQRGGRQQNHHGYFLDTATLGGAMLGGRPSLKRLAELLGTEHQKTDGDHGKEITPEYLDYLINDVQVTCECGQELHERYDNYRLPKPPRQIHSEASIGKAHLEKMGLSPFQSLNDWPHRITAAVIETYYGGRTECAIRRIPVPGVYVDFTSQYPTVFVLQDLQRFLTAKQVQYEYEDPGRAQRLLDQLEIDQLLDRRFWERELHAVVLVAPDGDRLPTRCRYHARARQYDSAARRKSPTGSYNVGIQYRSGGPPQWYTLADAAASKLMTGKAPRILAVLRFTAQGTQAGLCPIEIAGNPTYRVDPRNEDFIKRLVELRADVRVEQKHAKAAGDADGASTLSAVQQAMKATANATSYGSAIELNPVEHRKGAWVTVQLPDGSAYRVHQDRTEEPGRWFHPLIATLVAGAGRLLLGVAMRLLADLGGSYAFCDTDSLFIVATRKGTLIPCPGGQHRIDGGEPGLKAISHRQVDELVALFVALDPYSGPGHPKSILEIEDENYDPETGHQREIECFAIASKRYGLFVSRADGTPAIINSGDKKKRSEHGLGHLLPPNAADPEISDRAWLDEWWEHLLHLELGYTDHPEPAWLDDPAVGRLTVTSQRDIKAFDAYNHQLPYQQQVKPWGFLTIAHPAPYERARGVRTLIAPFERDPVRRLQAHWIDRDKPEQFPKRIHTAETPQLLPGSVAVLSYRDYFNQYRHHPESKALDPHDGKPCHTWTRGLLRPWHITAGKHVRVGKESNRLTETRQSTDNEDEQVIEYASPERKCRGCDTTVTGTRRWCSEACRKRYARKARPVAALRPQASSPG